MSGAPPESRAQPDEPAESRPSSAAFSSSAASAQPLSVAAACPVDQGAGQAVGELDLTVLEKAAERAGLGALKAELVAADPRRDRWFRWTADTLEVNERVLERLVPQDACVLLLNSILLARRRKQLVPRLVLVALLGVGALTLGLMFLPGVFSWFAPFAGVLLGFVMAGSWSWSAQRADDDTVAWLGEADTLCRALNTMDQDRLQLGKRRVGTRPDLHQRAERLVKMYELRLAPEDRAVAPIERRGPDVLG